MQNLFYLFDQIERLNRPLRNYILSCLKRVEFPKKHIFLREGSIPRYIYFIESGLIRAYELVNDKEKTMYFMRENDLLVSVGAFFSQRPATETMETLEPCVCWRISYRQLQDAYKKYRQFNLHRGVILERYYEYSERRNRMRLRSKAYKYEFLMAHEPWLLERVPSDYLASYLGISLRAFKSHKKQLLRGEYKG